MGNLRFYGYDSLVGKSFMSLREEYNNVKSPIELYLLLSKCWVSETCAPRMRDKWTIDNMTYGQCSITAFLVQDIFGGEVYGVPRDNGNYHCFNKIDEYIFDLTSEQFGDEKLIYNLEYPQSREIHFAKEEKYKRYLLLSTLLQEKLS